MCRVEVKEEKLVQVWYYFSGKEGDTKTIKEWVKDMRTHSISFSHYIPYIFLKLGWLLKVEGTASYKYYRPYDISKRTFIDKVYPELEKKLQQKRDYNRRKREERVEIKVDKIVYRVSRKQYFTILGYGLITGLLIGYFIFG